MLFRSNMKGIYLAAYLANHPGYDIDYQDILGNRDIGGDMMDVDLSNYDYVIATPPCNYYSRANYRRDVSEYALKTKHLLPGILKKLIALGKPFIVENVRNKRLFSQLGLFDLPCHIYFIGRHTYWTNILLFYDLPQKQDFIQHGIYIGGRSGISSREGGDNVHIVIETWLATVVSIYG